MKGPELNDIWQMGMITLKIVLKLKNNLYEWSNSSGIIARFSIVTQKRKKKEKMRMWSKKSNPSWSEKGKIKRP